MKELASPPPVDFDVYIARPETKWLAREGEPLRTLYAKGYLPYSGAKDSRDIFYSGRSARIILPHFEMTSENRRIAKRFDGPFTKERIPVAQFAPDEVFWDLALTYFAKKHGPNAMPRARIEALFNSGLITTVVVYMHGLAPVAYVLEIEDGDIAYYWYSYYDIAYARQSLGVWLMLDCIRTAKAAGKQYYYLGTVYGEKALYKTNFSPLEWWNGKHWSNDIRMLKELSHL